MDNKIKDLIKTSEEISRSGDGWSGEILYKTVGGEYCLYLYSAYDEVSPYTEEIEMISSTQAEDAMKRHKEFGKEKELKRRGAYEGILKQVIKRLAWRSLKATLGGEVEYNDDECIMRFDEHVACNRTSSVDYIITFFIKKDKYEVHGSLCESRDRISPFYYQKNNGDMVWI